MVNHIKNTINKVLENNYNTWQLNLMKNWPVIIGNLQSKVYIEKIYDDCIVLAVSDSCWMQELYLLSNLLINKINSNMDKPRIKTIRFMQAKYKKQKHTEKKELTKLEDIQINLNSNELIALKKIKDPELSHALKNFLIKTYKYK